MAKSRMDIEQALASLREGKLKQYLEANDWFPPHRLDTINNISFLHYATEQGCFELVRECVNEYSADINVKNGSHQTPLMWLLDRLGSCSAKDENYKNYARITIFLINHDKLDLNVTDDTKNNLVHFAACVNDPCFLHTLIARFNNANRSNKIKASLSDWINAINSLGRTPLHVAVRQDDLSQHNIEILLMAGAKPGLAEQVVNGIKPLERMKALANSSKKDNICRLLSATWPMQDMLKIYSAATTNLLRSISLPNLSDELGRAPLFYAACNGQLQYVGVLCQRNCDVNMPDIDGQTPLHAAAVAGHTEVVEYLLAQGADFKRKNSEQKTALECVKQLIAEQGDKSDKNFSTISKLLQEYQDDKFYLGKYKFELLLFLVLGVLLGIAALLIFTPFAPLVVTQFSVTLGLTKLQAFLSLSGILLASVAVIESIKLLCCNRCCFSSSNSDVKLDYQSYRPLLKNGKSSCDDEPEQTHGCFVSFLYPLRNCLSNFCSSKVKGADEQYQHVPYNR